MDIWALVSPLVNASLTAAILGFWKPWLASYGGEKGKTLARKEDIEVILNEVNRVTRVQEEIKTELSDRLWQRQMLTTEKKAIYSQLLLIVHGLLDKTSALRVLEKILVQSTNPSELERLKNSQNALLREFTDIEKELIRLHGLASIFASPDCEHLIRSFLLVKRGSEFLSDLALGAYFGRLLRLNEGIISAAKADLGVTPIQEV